MKRKGCLIVLVGCVLVVVALSILFSTLFSDYFTPEPEWILRESRWSPFIQACKEFDYATTSIDNGALVFVMYPRLKSATEYFSAVTKGLPDSGWTELPPGDNPLATTSAWYASYYRKTVARFARSPEMTRCYTRKFFPEDPEDKTMEIVLLTYSEGAGAVTFVSWYDR